jgi:hypothetical protein
VGFVFPKLKSFGPLRLTLSRRGLGASLGLGPLRIGRSATGRKTRSLRLLSGLFWRKK